MFFILLLFVNTVKYFNESEDNSRKSIQDILKQECLRIFRKKFALEFQKHIDFALLIKKTKTVK